MSTDYKISNLVPEQLPDFIRSDHPKFVAFLEAYYEYLEQFEEIQENGKVVERAKNFLNYIDIDKTIDAFADNLYNQFLKDLPNEIKGDKALILKNAKDFFRARGSEKSVKFLMRAIFGKEIDLYYPKSDVLRASDGKWYVKRSIRVTNTKVDGQANNSLAGMEKYIGRTVTGNKSNTVALVESVDRFFDKGVQIDELVLSGIKGRFISGETIKAVFDEENELKPITSVVFGGFVNNILITQGGANYKIGDPVIITANTAANTGNGAIAAVSRVSTGNIVGITVGSAGGGAGYIPGNPLLITGGGGFGAQAEILLTDLSQEFHPNTINIGWSQIGLEANTPIGNAVYSNLNFSNANTPIGNAVSYKTFTNVGPARIISILDPGFGFTGPPSISGIGNTRILNLGMLGRLDIVNGGLGYQANDKIEFLNPPGSYGTGARGNVRAVEANGMISNVYFDIIPGYPYGGMGYNPDIPPVARVISANGSGANISVTVMGTGGQFNPINSTIGAVEEVNIISGGTGYDMIPDVDFSKSGDGNAKGIAVIVEGLITYPGRYLNDDGHISSLNYLQDRDYYQNHSYVVRIQESIDNYRKFLKDLVHPAGMKMFAEHLQEDNSTDRDPMVKLVDNINTIEYVPALDLDFVNNTAASLYLSDIPIYNVVSCIRNTPGYAQNTMGHFIPFNNNELRITDRGILVEEFRVNFVRNSSGTGAAPGVNPNIWLLSPTAGLSKETVDVGVEDGIEYVDIRFTGNTTAGETYVYFDGTTNQPVGIGANGRCNVGETAVSSVFVKMVGGSKANVTGMDLFTLGIDSANSLSDVSATTIFQENIPGSDVPLGQTRMVNIKTMANNSTVSAFPRFNLNFASGNTKIDITMRFGWPQMEKGNNVSSPIRTTGSTGSRASDNILVSNNNINTYFDFSDPTGGASYVEWEELNGPNFVGNRVLWTGKIATSDYVRAAIAPTGHIFSALVSNNSGFSKVSTNSITLGKTYAAAMSWKTNMMSLKLSDNLGNPAGNTGTANVSSGNYELYIGSFGGGQYSMNYIRKLSLYKNPLPDDYLIKLVT